MDPETLPAGAQFLNKYAARIFLEELLWKGHPRCPRAHKSGVNDDVTLFKQSLNTGKRKSPFRTHKCNNCLKQFTVTTGTELEGVDQVHTWLLGVELLIEDPEISAGEIRRELKVHYDTAVRMKKKLPAFIARIRSLDSND